jgi:hypothetical protein
LKRHHSFVGCGAKLFISVGGAGCVPLSGQGLPRPPVGYLWLLGRRLHIKTAGDPTTRTSSATWGIPSQRGEAEAPRAEACGREEGCSSPR